MHAVVVSVTVDDPEGSTKNLREEIVPRISQAPGFVAGYWVRIEGGDKGRGTIACESEEAARGLAEQIQANPNPGVTIESVDIGEVVASA